MTHATVTETRKGCKLTHVLRAQVPAPFENSPSSSKSSPCRIYYEKSAKASGTPQHKPVFTYHIPVAHSYEGRMTPYTTLVGPEQKEILPGGKGTGGQVQASNMPVSTPMRLSRKPKSASNQQPPVSPKRAQVIEKIVNDSVYDSTFDPLAYLEQNTMYAEHAHALEVIRNAYRDQDPLVLESGDANIGRIEYERGNLERFMNVEAITDIARSYLRSVENVANTDLEKTARMYLTETTQERHLLRRKKYLACLRENANSDMGEYERMHDLFTRLIGVEDNRTAKLPHLVCGCYNEHLDESADASYNASDISSNDEVSPEMGMTTSSAEPTSEFLLRKRGKLHMSELSSPSTQIPRASLSSIIEVGGVLNPFASKPPESSLILDSHSH
ncbi:hypothetical protein GMRT_13499 [Giardia muris]|uniref:Uncharacterized protein n=1 Tax=Giardia muris TaxID=5742 RepID=A0A4Z1SWT9_GIAMU|nr:hypothetical protein GMRT_13499 [Giardia muris]|eukprot:TNJ27988.1 hypothetical protein GMRT_13499 [Giardia muris]